MKVANIMSYFSTIMQLFSYFLKFSLKFSRISEQLGKKKNKKIIVTWANYLTLLFLCYDILCYVKQKKIK